jgi:hypothetical protein
VLRLLVRAGESVCAGVRVQTQARLMEACVTHVLDVGLPRLTHRVRELVSSATAHLSVTDTLTEGSFKDVLTVVREVRPSVYVWASCVWRRGPRPRSPPLWLRCCVDAWMCG